MNDQQEDQEYYNFIIDLMENGDLEIIRNKQIKESLSKDENNFTEEKILCQQ